MSNYKEEVDRTERMAQRVMQNVTRITRELNRDSDINVSSLSGVYGAIRKAKDNRIKYASGKGGPFSVNDPNEARGGAILDLSNVVDFKIKMLVAMGDRKSVREVGDWYWNSGAFTFYDIVNSRISIGNEQYYKNEKGEWEYDPANGYPRILEDLENQSLKLDGDKRLTFPEVLELAEKNKFYINKCASTHMDRLIWYAIGE